MNSHIFNNRIATYSRVALTCFLGGNVSNQSCSLLAADTNVNKV